MRSWTTDIDPASIPDEVLKSERARRNALKRTSYSGGVYWSKHNPDTIRCRCRACMEKRKARLQYSVSLKHIYVIVFLLCSLHATTIQASAPRTDAGREGAPRSVTEIANRRPPRCATCADPFALSCRRNGEPDRPPPEDDTQERAQMD